MSLLRPALHACPRAAVPRSLAPRAPLRLFHAPAGRVAAAPAARSAAIAAPAARRGAYSLGLGLTLAGLALAPQTHEPLRCGASDAQWLVAAADSPQTTRAPPPTR
jgi:hypothetical protein